MRPDGERLHRPLTSLELPFSSFMTVPVGRNCKTYVDLVFINSRRVIVNRSIRNSWGAAIGILAFAMQRR